MPAPTSSLATLRPDLAGSFEEFNLEMDRRGFIGHRVLPVFDVAKASGVFGQIPLAQLLQSPDTKRAPGSAYARGDWDFTIGSFACQEHGWEEPVDENEAEMYAEYFDAEQVSTERALDIVLRNAEIRIANAIFNATTWSAATTSITHEWDDATNAVPIADVEAAVQAVWAASGLWPNALIINRKVFRNLRNCDEIVDRVKYGGFTDPLAGKITAEALAQAFDLDYVIVADNAKNTSKEGQAASISSIWSDEYAMVARICEGPDIRRPGLGRTFHWPGDGSDVNGTVESYRDETVRSDVIRVRHQVDEKVLLVAAGHLLSNVTT